MIRLFKEHQSDVKTIRSQLLLFIKEMIQRSGSGEGGNIHNMYLMINCPAAERHLYEAAVYSNVPGKFKEEEVQRMADDFALKLPASWKFNVMFTDKFPAGSYLANSMNAALYFTSAKAGLSGKGNRGYLRILSGLAEKEIYTVDSCSGKINVGREVQVQMPGGFVRRNHIAFVSHNNNNQNSSVSRHHAHIEWEESSGSFIVFADEGGIPPRNKMKIRRTDGYFIKLQATEVGHRLEEGDQVILGDTAVLEFTYTPAER